MGLILITKDNAPIDIDFLVYMRVDLNEAQRAVLEVEDYHSAVVGLATTTLRAVIGDIPLDDVLSQRDRINELIRARLDQETGRWGIKVTNVEISELIPPREIQDAMSRQMSAERVRRAVVTEAEGARQSNITVAEGGEAGRDPPGRRRQAVGDPTRGGLQRGADANLRGREGDRREDDDAAVPRNAEDPRGEPVVEVPASARVHAAPRRADGEDGLAGAYRAIVTST